MMSNEDKFCTVKLDEIINDYAWRRFLRTKNIILRPYHKMKKNKHEFDIRWGYAEFKHETVYFSLRTDETSRFLTSDKPSGPLPSLDAEGNRNVILYYSEYENLTPVPQQYTFSTTRETKASTSVSVEETHTIGGSTNIEIAVPGNIVTVGAGLSGELSVTDSECQSFEETMTWQVNTEINVKEGHKAQATVYVAERNSVADFEIKTTLSIPDGKDLPVVIRRKSDDEVVYTEIITDLRTVFREIAEKRPERIKLVQANDEKRHMKRFKLELLSRGSCKSISWKNQHVHVESVLLKKDDDNDSMRSGEDQH